MKKFLLFSMALAILLLCVIAVHSVPANTGGQSAADAEKEAWKKIKEQTADFLAHEREYVMSQRDPMGQVAVTEKTVAVNSAPVAAAPADAAPDSGATTLPPVTTVAPTNSSSTSVGNTAALPQTTTSVPAAA